MKTYTYSLLLLCSCLFMASQCQKPYKPDAKVLDFLGKPQWKHLSEADSIWLTEVDFSEPDSMAPHGWTNLWSKGVKLPEKTALLQLIGSAESYSFDNLAKNCGIKPNYIVSFLKQQENKADTSYLYISFPCDTWHFLYGDMVQTEDTETIREDLFQWVAAVEKSDRAQNTTPRVPKSLTTMTTEEHLAQLIGPDGTAHLLMASGAHAFLLDPEKKPADSATDFHGYAIVSQVNDLPAKQLNAFQALMANPKHHHEQDTVVKNCTFLPDLGVRLFVEGSSDDAPAYTDVLVAFYCDSWMLAHGDLMPIRDCASARNALLDFAKQVFPEDDYLKQLPARNY